MPTPKSMLMARQSKLRFQSFGIRVPSRWQPPSGDAAAMFSRALTPEQRQTEPAVGPNALFLAAAPNYYATSIQKQMSQDFADYIDAICDAVADAWDSWQLKAGLTGVGITGPTASGGTLSGPSLAEFVLDQGTQNPITPGLRKTPTLAKITRAIVNVLSVSWHQYAASIKVPGLPWYPAFAAVPAMIAPITPNVPTPLTSMLQVTVPLIPAQMKQQMVAAHGDPSAEYAAPLFEAICDGFDTVFKRWQTNTHVTNVLGTGPVPTFAPPTSPFGPVQGGTGNMTPGGFTTLPTAFAAGAAPTPDALNRNSL